MTAILLGRGAYKRLYGGTPEVKLLNRWLEVNPANLNEHVSILARPGTTPITTFNTGTFDDYAPMRGNYALGGLFNDSLFVVCGSNLYRVNQDMSVIHISGDIQGSGHPEVAWQKGLGYERLWIADGLLLQYYEGTTAASGTLTKVDTVVDGTDKIRIGSVYYVWGTTFSDTDDGSSTYPFVVNPTTTGAELDPLGQLELAINATGTAGTDYSSTLGGENTLAGAGVPSVVPATELVVTASTIGTGGNSISFSVIAGSAITASGSGTLEGGGVDALHGCEVPDGKAVLSISQVSSYIILAVADSQQFYWIQPGAIIIDALDYASKESSPDNIVHLRTVGDQVLIIGEKSTESWYATGDSTYPFQPIDGRVYARGAIEGTPVIIDDTVVLVGDDGRVYSIGYSSSDGTNASGINRISNNGIEERIRRQLRREEGLTP